MLETPLVNDTRELRIAVLGASAGIGCVDLGRVLINEHLLNRSGVCPLYPQ